MMKHLLASCILLVFATFVAASPPPLLPSSHTVKMQMIVASTTASTNLHSVIALPAERPHELTADISTISTDGTYLAENMTIDAFGAGLFSKMTIKANSVTVKALGALHIAPGWNSFIYTKNTTAKKTIRASMTSESTPDIKTSAAAINGKNNTGDPTIYSGFPAPVGWQSDISLFLLSTGMPVHSDQLAAALT